MIEFQMQEFSARFTDASGKALTRIQQVRVDPVTLRQSRITPIRSAEKERGTEKLYAPPASELDQSNCPFCPENLERLTPCLSTLIGAGKRLRRVDSILFPNLFPYTEWSAVSLFGADHYVEIGTASLTSYRDSFINCADYLCRVKKIDREAVYMSITQNHLPAAGGSLIHPHLQVHATRQISNNHRLIGQRSREYALHNNSPLLKDLLFAEKNNGVRYIGRSGVWEWLAAFAPSGFYELWGITTAASSLLLPEKKELWQDLAEGVLNTQKFYKSLHRNAYNLSLLSIEDGHVSSGLRIAITARSSYAPWVRNDITGFELASGEMATFTMPEDVAAMARVFWK